MQPMEEAGECRAEASQEHGFGVLPFTNTVALDKPLTLSEPHCPGAMNKDCVRPISWGDSDNTCILFTKVDLFGPFGLLYS